LFTCRFILHSPSPHLPSSLFPSLTPPLFYHPSFNYYVHQFCFSNPILTIHICQSPSHTTWSSV
jgi:hypothetical protein